MINRTSPPQCLTVLLLLSPLLNYLLPIKQLFRFPYSFFGIFFIIAGIVINLLADNRFKYHKTTVKPVGESTALMDDGPYRLTRNPMYLGMFAILLGESFLLGSITAFLAPVLSIFLLQYWFIIPEERKMEKIFGAAYINYKSKVSRWI